MKRPRNVDPNDKRTPMRRLLEDGRNANSDYVYVCYAAQWSTLFKAQRQGLLDKDSRLTAKGKMFLACAQHIDHQ